MTFCICLNCASRVLTSCTVRPEPLAIRSRRCPLMMSGLLRSFGVIESTMASTCFIFLSSTLAAWSIAGLMPGSRPRTFLSGPIFCICRIAPRKSSRSSPFFEVTFRASRSASFSSTATCAFSTSERMSPCWRIRPARRSGWNGSSASSFSPTPMYLIGAWVTP